MLHSKKSQSILQWFNSLTTKGNVNSLEQFTDGSYFYEILQPSFLQWNKDDNLAPENVVFSETSIACNEVVITSIEEEVPEEKIETPVSENVDPDPFAIKESDNTDTEKKYDAIRKCIDDFYHLDSSLLIDYDECQKGTELELAKVAIFLLSAIVQNLLTEKDSLPSEDKVVYNLNLLTLLEPEVQENIRECMSLVLEEKDVGETQLKKSDLHKVLSRAASYKGGTPLRKQPPRSTPDTIDLSEGVKNVPKKRKERTSVIASEDIQDSPVKSFLESPKIQHKVMLAILKKKEKELIKIKGFLYNEEEKVRNLTNSKADLHKELESTKKMLEKKKKLLQTLEDKQEDQEKQRAKELEDERKEKNRLKKLTENQEAEIKQLKEDNEALYKKVDDIEKKLKKDAADSLIDENSKLKKEIVNLECANKTKDEKIVALTEKNASLISDLEEYREHYSGARKSPANSRTGSPTNRSKIDYCPSLSGEISEKKENEPKQDLETKDERIKRNVPQQHKGETSHTNIDHLRGRVDDLEREKSMLKEKLQDYESAYGKLDEIPVPRYSIKKESDGIGSTTDVVSVGSTTDVVSGTKISVNSQHSDLKKVLSDPEVKTLFEKNQLVSIIQQLEERNFIPPEITKKLKEICSKIKLECEVSVCLRDLCDSLKSQSEKSSVIIQRSCSDFAAEVNANSLTKSSVTTRSSRSHTTVGKNANSLFDKEPSVTTRSSRSHAAVEINANSPFDKNKDSKSFRKQEKEFKMSIQKLEASNADLMKEIENFKQEVAITQEKYNNMKILLKEKEVLNKKCLRLIQKMTAQTNKDEESKKECGEDCEKLRMRCKQLNADCLDFEQEIAELKRSIKNLEGVMEHLQFEIKELKKEKKELQLKLWEETSALSKNTTDRDALVLHYLKKSKHEPKKDKKLQLRKEEHRKSSRPIVKVDAYILNSDNEPSTSNSVLASRSIRSSFFQVADEDDFLNESSLAEIHNGYIPEGESGEGRLLEIQRRNTLCPPHLQSSYPLEIQNMTPSERKYYNPDEVSFDMSRKSSLYPGKRDINQRMKSKYVESDSEESDDSHSFPVKKRKIAATDRISAPVSKKHYRPSGVAKVPSKDEGNPRKPSTPLKRTTAFVRRTFNTPLSINRLMGLPHRNKLHKN